ncbi:CYTH domain-containing protein [Ferrimonas aestuarii]|uniref:Uncharacterized protein n=1 Tax=Ferrimonas aestuarii TaxID=2569539 RepID=A0A4U1BS32_9GAMM|nr:hypothetical protein [Ferrimonas aestuarii]TKB56142.1 hypothetical protein FCL42_07965 [Ferrimonas aestuarii]
MRMNTFLWSLASLCLSANAQALTKDHFDKIEFAVNTGTGTTLPYATDSLTEEFNKAFGFINFEEDPAEKLVTYLDTPDRALKAQSISIRVREHVTKPGKSKITVKLRSPEPVGFGELSNYKKAEIDYDGKQDKYSVSYDIPYSPDEINVKSVDFGKVIDTIKQNQDAWDVVKTTLNQRGSDLKQTIVMRSYGWEGFMTDSRYDNIEVDFQVWTPYYRKPRIYFADFSFKGLTKDREDLTKAFQHLYDQVQATGLTEGMHTGSKTGATFKMSKGFH